MRFRNRFSMENFIVSARKYRPDVFSAVVGQASITKTLKNSIKSNKLGHAYLFSGPRGVGKTTCARIFSRTINCFNLTADGEACNQCESCESFNTNRSFNIHELDAASNNSVDDIRNLTDQVRIPPQVGSYSVYIIDEVHMLSQQAFNAFLKTLEEPPAHAVFILATTEKHKIIPTILSRCQIYDFNRISISDAVDYLKGIAENEGITFEEDALQVIARKADGAMRDALSIFDQVVSFSGKEITYKAVIDNLNILDLEYYFKLTNHLLASDISSSLMLFDEVLRKGFDARNFLNGYAEHLRDLLVCKDPQTIQLLEVGAGIREQYLAQSQSVSVDFLIAALDVCKQTDIDFRASRNQRLSIELALVKLASLGTDQKKKGIAQPDTSGMPSTESTENASGSPESESIDNNEDALGSGDVSQVPERPKQDAPPSESQVVRKAGISIKQSMAGRVPKAGETIHSGPSSANATGSSDSPDQPTDTPQDHVKETEGQSTGIDADKILNAWQTFAASMESVNPRVFATLKSHLPEIDSSGRIRVILNTESQKDHFVKSIKPGLVDYFRQHLGSGDYPIEALVETNNVSEKKIYTDQDKFDYLLGKNPDLGKLRTTFNLDFDN